MLSLMLILQSPSRVGHHISKLQSPLGREPQMCRKKESPPHCSRWPRSTTHACRILLGCIHFGLCTATLDTAVTEMPLRTNDKFCNFKTSCSGKMLRRARCALNSQTSACHHANVQLGLRTQHSKTRDSDGGSSACFSRTLAQCSLYTLLAEG